MKIKFKKGAPCPIAAMAGRPAPLADGKEQEHKERDSIILLLDGLMERGREGAACPPGELQEGGSRDRPAEGPMPP